MLSWDLEVTFWKNGLPRRHWLHTPHAVTRFNRQCWLNKNTRTRLIIFIFKMPPNRKRLGTAGVVEFIYRKKKTAFVLSSNRNVGIERKQLLVTRDFSRARNGVDVGLFFSRVTALRTNFALLNRKTRSPRLECDVNDCTEFRTLRTVPSVFEVLKWQLTVFETSERFCNSFAEL